MLYLDNYVLLAALTMFLTTGSVFFCVSTYYLFAFWKAPRRINETLEEIGKEVYQIGESLDIGLHNININLQQ